MPYANTSLLSRSLSIVAATGEDVEAGTRNLHGDHMKAVLRGGNILRIEAEIVLRAQLAQDLIESGIERRSEAGSEDAAAGALCDSCERVLAAGVAPRVIGDGNYQDRINDSFGKLRGFERGVEVNVASGVAAVGNDDEHVPSVAPFGAARCQINRIIQRRAAFRAESSQSIFKLVDAPREGGLQRHLPVKGVERRGVFRISFAQERMQKAGYRIELVVEVFGGRSTSVHHHGDRKRLLSTPLKHGDGLRHAVVEHGEILLVERSH